MPSFADTAFIALLALLLFGPKKLPELARQFGKLMGEFRRASNEFRMQMEDELRLSEQEEQKKKIAAMEAAAPVAPPLLQDETIVIDHPHQPAVAVFEERTDENTIAAPISNATDQIADAEKPERHTVAAQAPLPIASSGSLTMMPPSTGLPLSRSSASALTPVLDGIPHTAEADMPPPFNSPAEATLHG